MTNYDYPTLVKKLRDKLIISQEELAKLLEVSLLRLIVGRMVILNQQSKQKENSLNYAKRMESRLSSYGFCYI